MSIPPIMVNVVQFGIVIRPASSAIPRILVSIEPSAIRCHRTTNNIVSVGRGDTLGHRHELAARIARLPGKTDTAPAPLQISLHAAASSRALATT